MSHHLKAPSTDSVDDLRTFFGIGDLELLLQENGSLLIGGLDNAGHEQGVWWAR